MKTSYKIIIGISVPLVLFGILVLLIGNNVSQILANSDRWMVELEPSLNLNSVELFSQMRDEDLKELKIYRVQSLEDYFESLSPNLEKQFKAARHTENRFVFFIDKRSPYSDEQIHEILTEIEGIKDAKYLNDWLLR